MPKLYLLYRLLIRFVGKHRAEHVVFIDNNHFVKVSKERLEILSVLNKDNYGC